MTHNLKIILLLLSFSNLLAQQKAKPTDYNFEHYTDENGLPQNSVKSIAKDNLGFLWIVTENGLVRFDGKNFYNYNKSDFPSASLRFYYLLKNTSEQTGKLEAVTEEGTYFTISNGKPTFHPKQYRDLYPYFPGFKLYLTEFAYKIVPNELFLMNERYHFILPDAGIRSAFFISQDTVHFFNSGRVAARKSFHLNRANRYFTLGNKLFVKTFDKKIQRLDSLGSHPVTINGDIKNSSDSQLLPHGSRFYWCQPSGQAFLVDENKVLYSLYPSIGDEFIARRILDNFDIDDNTIACIYYNDKTRRVYIGSSVDGLYIASPKLFQIPRHANREINDALYGQAPYGGNKVVVSNGDIFEEGLQSGLSQAYAIRDQSPDYGRSMTRDKLGNIWTTNRRNSLYRFNSSGTRLLDSLTMRSDINTIYQDSAGTMWIGLESVGIQQIKVNDNHIKLTSFKTPSLPSVRYITQQDKDTLLVGTSKGLYKLSTDNSAILHIQGTSSFNIRSLYYSDGNLFVSTYGNGLLFYSNGKLKQFPSDRDGFMNTAHCIIADKRGFLWIPTNKGLFQFSKQELLTWAAETDPDWKPYYLYYDVTNGLKTNEFNGGCQPCAVRLENGVVSVPTIKGLVWFKPESFKIDSPYSALIIDRVLVGDRLRVVGKTAMLITQDEHQIDIHVATPHMGNIKNLILEYNVISQGSSQNKWVYLRPNDPVIRFSSLAAGNYTIMVRKRLGFGKSNCVTTQFDIQVPPYWYETSWFKIVILLSIGLLSWGYVKLRTNKVIRKNQEVESLINQRTADLKQTLEKLQTSEKELIRQVSIRTHLMSAVSHDIRTPMRYVIIATEFLEKTIAKYQDEDANRIANGIVESSGRLIVLLDNMISYIETVYYDDRLIVSEIKLLELLQEKKELFARAFEKQENNLICNVAPETIIKTNFPLFSIILHNLLDNANKVSYEGDIVVYTVHKNDKISIFIQDCGPGFNEQQLQWLNTKSDNEDESIVSKDFRGLGLVIVKELCAVLGITLHATNSNGALLTLILPETCPQPISITKIK